MNKIYSILFCSILFYSILFYSSITAVPMDSFSFTFPSFTTFLSPNCLTVGQHFTCKYASIEACLFSVVFGKENLSFLTALCFAVLFIKGVLPVSFCSASVFEVLSLILSLYLCFWILSFFPFQKQLVGLSLFSLFNSIRLYDFICKVKR